MEFNGRVLMAASNIYLSRNFKDIINSYNYSFKNENFSIKTTND